MKPRILFVEDDQILREHLARVLSDEYDVETACDGEQALQRVLAQRPELVITDVVMPGIDGIELVRTLRSTPSTQTIPVLLTSGRAPEELRIEGFEEGADGFLPKPYRARELRAHIRSLLASSHLRRQAAQKEARLQAEKNAVTERAALLESITDAFYALDRQWRFTYVNQRALDYYEKRSEDLLGKRVWDVFPVAKGTIFEVEYERAVREHCSVAFESFSPLTSRWIEVHAYPTTQGLAVNFREISDRKHAEQELQATLARLRGRERRLELASEVAGLGIFVWDLHEDRFTSENMRSYEIFGRTPQDPKLSSWDFLERFVHPEDRESFEQQLREAMSSGSLLRTSCRIRRQNDGAWRWLEIASSVEAGPDGAPAQMIGILKDITERRRTEEAVREGDRRKDEFLAVLAHELRNPLAPIRNGLQIVRLRATSDATLQGVVSMMDRQMTHVVRLVDDLLDISRITHGKLELRRQKVFLTDALANAIDASRVFIETHGHEFVVNVRADDLAVDGDPDRLAQVFSNLLSNSAKYTDRGGRIVLTLERENDKAVVSVQDNGIGIDPSALEHVFEMFSQVGSKREHTHGGLGIGLSLVRSLVQMHDGVITASSAGTKKGSTFTVRLPLARKDVPDATEETPRSSAVAGGEGRRVLVADDNADAAASLAMLLELEGYEVSTASDGQEAIERAAQLRPDIIFMDLGMPRMDGIEAARRIRASTHGAQVSIIALTGWGQSLDRRRTQEAGMNHHLVKPLSLEHLRDVLSKVAEAASSRSS